MGNTTPSTPSMETQLLREPDIFPSKEVLQKALGKAYAVLEALEARLGQEDFALHFSWHYYRDSKAWLCKVCHKKKTVFWLSVWKGFFKTSFFFLERHMEGIAALELAEGAYTTEKEWGRMIPLVFNLSHPQHMADVLKLIQYKKATT